MQMILDVPYHEQLDSTTCGAACLKMALEAKTIRGNTATEAQLFTETESPEWGSATDKGSSPRNIANAFKARGGQPALSVDVHMPAGPHAEAELIRRMIWSIENAGVPPIALVAYAEGSPFGDGHWMVVVGYHADRAPTGPTDEGCVVSALEFNNPMRAAGDQKYPDHVSYAWWRRRYMKRVGDRTDGNVHYKGSVVAVAGGTP